MATEDDIDVVFAGFDSLLRAGNFVSCNAAMEAMYRDCTSVDLLLSALSMTLAAPEGKVLFRKRIAGKIVKILKVRNEPDERIVRILDGLI